MWFSVEVAGACQVQFGGYDRVRFWRVHSTWQRLHKLLPTRCRGRGGADEDPGLFQVPLLALSGAIYVMMIYSSSISPPATFWVQRHSIPTIVLDWWLLNATQSSSTHTTHTTHIISRWQSEHPSPLPRHGYDTWPLGLTYTSPGLLWWAGAMGG